MGFLDLFKKKEKQKHLISAPVFDNSIPINYKSSYTSIDSCGLILEAIHAIQGEVMKVNPAHIVLKDGVEVEDKSSSISKVLKRPNKYNTWADFASKIVFLREINGNAYIYPEYYLSVSGKKVFTGLYPLNPKEVSYLIDDGGRYYIKFTFENGYEITLPVEEVIHWRKNYDADEYFGGNKYSTRELLDAVNNYNTLCQSIAKAVGASCQINGIMRANTYMDDEKLEKQRVEFEEKLNNNKSGILYTDLKTEYIDLPRDVKIVDAETLQFFYDSILMCTGTPRAILSGDYTKAQKESWYERAIEPLLTSLAQAMEKCFFTEREDSFGNKIMIYPKSIVFMSMENKISALQTMLPAGCLTRDEARELLGYAPLPNGIGSQLSQGYNTTISTGGDEQ